jgi:hypothetical protein
MTIMRKTEICAAFLANIDSHSSATVHFNGKVFHLPPWSVSILPDCKHVAFNTAKVCFLLTRSFISLTYYLLMLKAQLCTGLGG